MTHLADRVRETTSTTGTGNITLSGASTGFETFDVNFAINQEFSYCIQNDSGSEWEIGSGYLTGSTTLVRDQVYQSTNSNALVNFSAGVKQVFCPVTAKDIYHRGHLFAYKAGLAGN